MAIGAVDIKSDPVCSWPIDPDMAMAAAQAQIKPRPCVDVQVMQKVMAAWPLDTNMATGCVTDPRNLCDI